LLKANFRAKIQTLTGNTNSSLSLSYNEYQWLQRRAEHSSGLEVVLLESKFEFSLCLSERRPSRRQLPDLRIAKYGSRSMRGMIEWRATYQIIS
jgi:hypothetical protein